MLKRKNSLKENVKKKENLIENVKKKKIKGEC